MKHDDRDLSYCTSYEARSGSILPAPTAIGGKKGYTAAAFLECSPSGPGTGALASSLRAAPAAASPGFPKFNNASAIGGGGGEGTGGGKEKGKGEKQSFAA